MKELFKTYGITRERFLQALSTVRGNQRVVSDNPEATYDTLEKYGYDLVERARNQKLDPVIGRDSEIRHTIQICPEEPRITRSSSENRGRQDRSCRRAGSADSQRRRTGRSERQDDFRPGYGRPDCGSQVPRRV